MPGNGFTGLSNNFVTIKLKTCNMKIGFIGLGKMGFNMVQRLLNDHHEIVVWNRSQVAVEEISKKGAIGAGE